MKYIKRHITPILIRNFKNNKVLSISGARQVGKSTLIKNEFKDIKSVNFDNNLLRAQVIDDPKGFLDYNGVPLFIDEAQKVENIFEFLKDKIDSENLGYKSYIISGSQNLKLKKGQESLAGRISINELTGLSLREINNIEFYNPFIPDDKYINEREKCLKKYKNIWKVIHRGQYPELYQNSNKDWEDFYKSYLSTYLERDISNLITTKNFLTFTKFMTSVAARTGCVLNCYNIASEIGVNEKTVLEWINILVRSNIIFLLKPYYNNSLNRAIKSPKIYFRDTGLCCYLTRWLSDETARAGAMSGQLFETFVVNEIIKSYSNSGHDYDFSLFYYRGKDKIKRKVFNDNQVILENITNEIDLIIQVGDKLYPIEIKETSKPTKAMTNAFDVLDIDKNIKRMRGIILCTYSEKLLLRDNLIALPIEYI